MNKKGFTLIELLAVIVILAIIALIAIPIVLNIISDVRENSTEVSMKNIEKAASLYFQQNRKDENIIFECSKDKCKYNNKELELNGKSPESGKILIDKKGNITYEDIVINGFNCYKEHEKFVCDTKKIRKVYNESKIIIDSKSEYNLFDYNIYGNSIQNEETLQYESVGDKTKNLFDKNTFELWLSYGGGGAGTSIFTGANKVYATNLNFPLKSNTQYTFIINNDVYWLDRIAELDDSEICTANHAFYASTNKIYSRYSWTTKATTTHAAIRFRRVDGADLTEDDLNNLTFYLEEGSTATEYEPYDKYKISVKSYIGNLYDKNSIDQDGVYFSSSTSDFISSNENWEITGYLELPSDTKKITISIPDDSTTNIGVGAYTVFYDKDKKYLGSGIQKNKKTTISVPTGSKYFRTSVRKIVKDVWLIEPENNQLKTGNIYLDEPLRKVEDKADYIDFKNQKVVRYIEEDSLGNLKVLSVPKEEKIELPEILLRKGVNNIEIGTSIKPSKIELEYYK